MDLSPDDPTVSAPPRLRGEFLKKTNHARCRRWRAMPAISDHPISRSPDHPIFWECL